MLKKVYTFKVLSILAPLVVDLTKNPNSGGKMEVSWPLVIVYLIKLASLIVIELGFFLVKQLL